MKYLLLTLACILFSSVAQERFDYLQPFYCTLDGKTYFIAYDGDEKFMDVHFEDSLKYGIYSDEPRQILPVEYEKVYNPNLILLGCFEIKKNGKVGMFNYKTGEVLEPRFDYIMPSGAMPTHIAYGNDAGQWYRLTSDNIAEPVIINFDPKPVLASLSFDLHKIGPNYWYRTSDKTLGVGVVIIPSWLERLKLFNEDYYDDVNLNVQPDDSRGVVKSVAKIEKEKTPFESLWKFVVNVYEKGISIRPYEVEKRNVITYSPSSSKLYFAKLTEKNFFDSPCQEEQFRFVSDSLIEIRRFERRVKDTQFLYDFEHRYEYLSIIPNGKIIETKSNRYFNFTRVVKIDIHYFNGCFINYCPPHQETQENNVWRSDHLSISDLDLMKNEIYADYGYRFKSEKWRNYFAEKEWYKPDSDDVSDKMTERDKHNVRQIILRQEQMFSNEIKYTKKRKDTFYVLD